MFFNGVFFSEVAFAEIYGFQNLNPRARTVHPVPQLVPSTNEMLSRKTQALVQIAYLPNKKVLNARQGGIRLFMAP